jgi:hypothetical protein
MPKRMDNEYCYPTQIYFTDPAEAATLNANIIPAIHAWRDADPGGMERRISDALDLTMSR